MAEANGDYIARPENDFASLRELPIKIFLAQAASYLFEQSIDELGGMPVKYVDLPEIIDETRGLKESVSADYNCATGEVKLNYHWSARKGEESSGFGSTEVRRPKFDDSGVEWAMRQSNGLQRAVREVIEPSTLHEAYFREVVIRALVHRSKDSLRRVESPKIETVTSKYL